MKETYSRCSKHKLVFSVDYDITSKFTVGADYEYRAAAFIDNAIKMEKIKLNQYLI